MAFPKAQFWIDVRGHFTDAKSPLANSQAELRILYLVGHCMIVTVSSVVSFLHIDRCWRSARGLRDDAAAGTSRYGTWEPLSS